MKTEPLLNLERENLAEQVRESYSPDDFPGSANWRITRNHQKALDVFDAAHPEIITKIKAERKAQDAETAKAVGWI